MYSNEKEVGIAIKKSGNPRNEIFLTSKLWISEYDKAYEGIEKNFKRLDRFNIITLTKEEIILKHKKIWNKLMKKV